MAAHLVSKKHAEAGARPVEGTKTKAARESPADEVPELADEVQDLSLAGDKPAKKAAKVTKKAGRDGALPSDPEKAGHFWCGICQVSLSAAKAEGHLETARHKENSGKHLTAAMKTAKPPRANK
jgi:hypothetical protein